MWQYQKKVHVFINYWWGERLLTFLILQVFPFVRRRDLGKNFWILCVRKNLLFLLPEYPLRRRFQNRKKDTPSLHFFSSLNWRSRPLLCEWADNGCLCWSKGISIIHTQLFNPWKMPNSVNKDFGNASKISATLRHPTTCKFQVSFPLLQLLRLIGTATKIGLS